MATVTTTTTPQIEQPVIDHSKKTTHRPLVNGIAGGFGGVFAKSLLAPLQRIVVLQQLGDHKHLSSVQIAQKIAREEGIAKGFWRGNLTSAIQRIPYGGFQLMAYDSCKGFIMNLLGEEDSVTVAAEQKGTAKKTADGQNASVAASASSSSESKKPNKTVAQHLKGLLSKSIAGGMAAGISGSLVYPIEVVRTRLMSGDERYRTIPQTVRAVWAETNGPRNFYKGLNASLIQRVPDILINFVVFETIKFELMERGYSSTAQIICGGAAAALVAIAFTFPLDVCKRRIAMANQLKSGKVYSGTFQALRDIYTEGGVRAMYPGAKLEAARCVPQVILMWYFIETFRAGLNKVL